MKHNVFLMLGSFFVATALVVADEPSTDWPPKLRGVQNGQTQFSTPSLLDVPEEVRREAAVPGAASFEVAKLPPSVRLVFHDQLGADAASRRLWSSWGDICLASDGRVYCAIGDHGNDVGGDARCFLYRWDPIALRLEQVVDMNRVVPPKVGRPSWSKVHAKIDEGPDGNIYFSCTLNDGNRAKLPTHHWDEELPGGQLYQFDPATGKTTVFANLPPRRCTATSLVDRGRNIWWCNLEAGDGNALYGLDLATRKPLFQAPDGSLGFNRAFALAADGSIYFNGVDRLMKWNAADGKIEKLDASFGESPGMRCATRESREGMIYGVTHKTNQLFRFSTRDKKLALLGPSWLGGAYTTVIELSPDERFLYYLPGAHGGAFKHGTPIVRYELAGGKQTVLAFLAPYCERAIGYVPAGTYGMKLSADGRKMFVNFNGHPVTEWLPKHLRPNGFGLCAFAEIELAK